MHLIKHYQQSKALRFQTIFINQHFLTVRFLITSRYSQPFDHVRKTLLHEAVPNPEAIGIINRVELDENLKTQGNVKSTTNLLNVVVKYELGLCLNLVEQRQEVSDSADLSQSLSYIDCVVRGDVPDVNDICRLNVLLQRQTIKQKHQFMVFTLE